MKTKNKISFSASINKEVKRLLDNFCKARGLTVSQTLEKALIQFLEDEMDSIIIEKRNLEKLVEWKQHG